MRRNIFAIFSAFILILASGCVRTEDPDTAPLIDGARIVGFSPRVDAQWTHSASAAETRAPGTTVDNQVKDIWVFQFDGTDKSASKLVSPPKYQSGTANVTLTDRGTADQLIVVLANYNDPDIRWGLTVGQSTFADLEERTIEISEEAGLYPNDAVLMYAETTIKVNSSMAATIPLNMKYPMARLNLMLSCTDTNIEVENIFVGNVPVRMDMFPKLNVTGIYPAKGSVRHIIYDDVSVTGLGATAQTFIWYVPQNCQGSDTRSTLPETKNTVAPQGATYITVTARDKTTGGPVVYTFYPGDNTTDDFNIRASHSYNMTIRITGKNSAIIDSRVDDRKVVSFLGDPANTYILNPPISGKIIYRIYPTQVDLFWGQRYEDVPENMLYDDEPWTVELLWMDEPGMVGTTNDKITLSKSTGAGVNDHFDITVPSGAKRGNFTVRIYRDNDAGKTTLWSWLLWVTDYNPDVSRLAVASDEYVYPVQNGNVFRLMDNVRKPGAPSLWADGGVYANCFLMDRHIGERGAYQLYSKQWNLTDVTTGAIHFAWGRKDPWPASDVTNINGDPVAFTYSNSYGQTLADQVKDPYTFYRYPEIISNSHYNWNDKYLPISSKPELTVGTDSKSLYDPCPPGWRIPNAFTFADFQSNISIKSDGRDLGYDKDDKPGYRYWPYVEVDGVYPVGGTVTFMNALSRSSFGEVISQGGMHTNFPEGSTGRTVEINSYESCGPDGIEITTRTAVSARCVSMNKR